MLTTARELVLDSLLNVSSSSQYNFNMNTSPTVFWPQKSESSSGKKAIYWWCNWGNAGQFFPRKRIFPPLQSVRRRRMKRWLLWAQRTRPMTTAVSKRNYHEIMATAAFLSSRQSLSSGFYGPEVKVEIYCSTVLFLRLNHGAASIKLLPCWQ